jgi:transposase-like protein
MNKVIYVPATLMEAIKHFADPLTCVNFVAYLRWEDGPVCPRCASKRLSFLTTRLMWKCLDCKKQFSVKVDSIFEDSALGLDKWLCAMWMLVDCKNGVSSYEIARDLGITQKSAWFMLHRIRHAMQTGSFKKFSGEVEADETFVGGKMANMHAHRQAKLRAAGRGRRGGVLGKAIVSGLLDRNTREARVKVMGNVRQFGLRTNIAENVEQGSTVYSDALKSYRNLGADGFIHEFIDHTEAYVKGRIHTNGLENFWSLFKRALKGTYVSVEPFHLQAYADEQAFRFNKRKTTDADRFVQLCSMVAGRRLTWNQLTGKNAVDR